MTQVTQTTAITLGLKSQLIEDYLYKKGTPTLSATGDMLALGDGLVVADGTALYHYMPDATSPSGWGMTQIPYAVPANAVDGTHVAIKAFAMGQWQHILCFYRAAGGGFTIAWMTRSVDQTDSKGNVTVRGSWRPANLSFAAASCLSQVIDIDVYDGGSGIGFIVYGATMPMLSPATPLNNAQLFLIYFGDYTKLDSDQWRLGQQSDLSAHNIAHGALPCFRILSTGSPGTQGTTALAWWDTQSPGNVSWCQVVVGANGSMTFPLGFADGAFRPWQTSTYALQSGETIQSLEPIRVPLDTDVQSWTAIVRSTSSVVRLQLGKPLDNTPVFYATETSLMPTSLGAVDSLDLTVGPDDNVSLIASIGNSLYILRKLDGTWVSLGNKITAWTNQNGALQASVTAIAVPGTHAGAMSLFYASSINDGTGQVGYEILHMSEDLTHEAWITQDIGLLLPDTTDVSLPAKDMPAPKEVASVSIDVSVVDQSKRPSPFAQVTLTTDQWGTYIIDEWIGDAFSGTSIASSYWLGPGTSRTFVTDGAGLANVRHEAHSLQFAKLSFTAAAASNKTIQAPALWVQGDVVEDQDLTSPVQPPTPRVSSVAGRLAGLDPLHPMSRARLEAHGLIAPIANGGPTDDSVTHMTNMLASTGQWMLKQSAPPLPTAVPRRKWRLTRNKGGTFDWTEEKPARSLGAAFSWNPLDDISHAYHDVTNAVKNGAEDFASATVDVAEEGLTFAINVGEQVVSVAAKTLKQAGDLVGTIFALVGKVAGDIVAFIKKVVEFLKMLLEWEDICRTHKVIKQVFSWVLAAGVDKTDSAKQDVDKFSVTSYMNRHFASHFTGTLKAHLDKAKAYHPKETANGRADTVTSRQSGQPGAMTDTTQRSHLDHHSSACHYAYNRVKSHIPSIGSGGTLDQTVVDTIKSTWPSSKCPAPATSSQSASSTPTPVDTAIAALLSKLEGIDIANILDQPLEFLCDLFTDLVKLAVEGVQIVIEALLEAVHEIIKGFQYVVEKSIHIPVITWLYETITGDDFSLLDLFCIIAAVPATILYKLAKGGDAPYASDDDMNAAINAFVINEKEGTVALKLDTGAVPVLEKVLGVTSGVVNLFASQFGIWSDGLTIVAAAAEPEQEIPNPMGWPTLALSAAALAAAVPLSTFVAYDDTEATSICATIYYGLEWLPLAADLYALRKGKALTRNYPNFGPIAEGMFGFAITAAGLAYIIASEAQSPTTDAAPLFGFVNVLVSSLPRPLRLTIPAATGDMEAAVPVTAVVCGGDEIGLFAGSATQIASSL